MLTPLDHVPRTRIYQVKLSLTMFELSVRISPKVGIIMQCWQGQSGLTSVLDIVEVNLRALSDLFLFDFGGNKMSQATKTA